MVQINGNTTTMTTSGYQALMGELKRLRGRERDSNQELETLRRKKEDLVSQNQTLRILADELGWKLEVERSAHGHTPRRSGRASRSER